MVIMKRFFFLLLAISMVANIVDAQEDGADYKRMLLAKSDSLFAVGEDLYNAGKYEDAIRLGTEALNIRENALGKDHPDYALSLISLAYYNSKLGNYSEAVRLGTKALNILEKVNGTDVYLLNILASYNSKLGNYAEAIRLGTEAMNIREKVLGKEHPDYATSLSSLAVYNAYLGNYSEAIRLDTEALNIIEKVYGKEHPYYVLSLNNLANYNSDLGNCQETIRLGTEALNLGEKMYGKEHPDYASSLSVLATYNAYLGDYQEAIRLGTEALNIIEKVYGKEHPYYANMLNNLAGHKAHLGNYSEAINLCTEALNIRECVLGKEHPDYTLSLNNLASYNFHLGNYSEAINLCTEALNIRESVLGKEHPDYATSLSNLASYNAYLGNYQEAIRLDTEALNIFEKVYGKEHFDYAVSLRSLADHNFKAGDSQSTNYYITESLSLISYLIKKTFTDLTGRQRIMFWEKYKNWYETMLQQYSFRMPTNTLTQCGYNAALLSKGLLLNSEIEFTRLLQESGDEEALALLKELQTLKNRIAKLQERQQSTDSLSRESDRVEQQLVERSKVYGDYTKNLVITWEKVQEKLTDKDVALEFVSFPLNADSTMYIAYALKKDWEYPKMIPLFEEKQLLAVQKGDKYATDSISRLVWQPLDEVMQGIERVYFAPSGELYNIAIESIPTHEDGGETLVGEHRDFYRLSSTRELALIKDESRWDEAAVYGGLQYGMSVEGMIEEDGKYEKVAGQKRGDSTPSYYIVREDSIGRGDRDLAQGLAYLEGTKREAEAITHDLEQKAVDARLFTDSIGTETSFKALDGKKTSIIHIGTHGFFNDKKKEYKEDKLQLLGIDQQAKVIEDDALNRSGLYFAGADNVRLNGLSAIPDSIDDGRLTAAEIAQLDLRGLDMVVLSACQTGLGEITGDGVFGLQRGFKKAGAQTIVMSLWKVDDEATRLFMTKFFEEIRLDKEGYPTNKHEAFLAAQHYLRDEYEIEQTRIINSNLTASQIRRLEREGKSVEAQTITEKVKPYAAPKYWAAFIMLDGIN